MESNPGRLRASLHRQPLGHTDLNESELKYYLNNTLSNQLIVSVTITALIFIVIDCFV